MSTALAHPHAAVWRARPQGDAWARALWTAILFGCGVFVWLFKPTYGEAAIIPFSPMQIALPSLGIICAALLLLAHRTRFPVVMVAGWSSALLILGNLCILFGTIPFLVARGDARMDAILYVFRWLMPLCSILILFVALRQGASARSLVLGLMSGAVLTVLCVELARAGVNLPIHKMSDARYAGFLQHANQYGILISSTAPFIVYLVYSRVRWLKLFGVAMFAIYCLALFQCMSKTNMVLFPLALAFGFILLSLHNIAALVRATFMLVVLSVFLAAAGWIVLQVARELAPQDAAVLERMINDPRDVKSLDERNYIWDEAKDNIRRRPWLGFGPGWTVNNMSLPHAHNLVLQVWLETGAAGLVGIWLVMLAVFLRFASMVGAAFRDRGMAPEETVIQRMAALAAVISLLGNSMSASLSTATMITFVLLLALCFTEWPEPLRFAANDAR